MVSLSLKKLLKAIVNSPVTWSPAIDWAVTDTMIAWIWEYLNLMAYKATTSTMSQPKIEEPDQSFAALNEKIPGFTPAI